MRIWNPDHVEQTVAQEMFWVDFDEAHGGAESWLARFLELGFSLDKEDN